MSLPLVINVRFNSSHCTPILADTSWTISQLKCAIGLKHDTAPDDIRIIFQGKEPLDTMCLVDSDLANQSVLHAVRGRRPVLNMQATSQGLNDISSLVDNVSEDTVQEHVPAAESPPRRPQFYVYCKTECKAVKPGRLRVRCSTCKQGTITVQQGPSDWNDVLHPARISGDCLAEKCPGNTAEFYFKCCGHDSASESESAAPLQMIRANSRVKPCLTCTAVESPILIFPCTDSHVMCLNCFNVYCTTRLNDRAFVYCPESGYTLGCPAGCEDSLITEGHHFRVLGAEQYDRYQRFATEEYLLQSGGVLCPTAGCGAGLLPEQGERRVECVREGAQGCGFVFCRQCKGPYHQGDCDQRLRQAVTMATTHNNYEVDREAAERARWDLESMSTIDKTTKPCPKCRTATEKGGGCMHMTCRCGFDWCWMCAKEWNRDCQGDHWFG